MQFVYICLSKCFICAISCRMYKNAMLTTFQELILGMKSKKLKKMNASFNAIISPTEINMHDIEYLGDRLFIPVTCLSPVALNVSIHSLIDALLVCDSSALTPTHRPVFTKELSQD